MASVTPLIHLFPDHFPNHCKALNSLLCADVPLRNYSLTLTAASGLVVTYSMQEAPFSVP